MPPFALRLPNLDDCILKSFRRKYVNTHSPKVRWQMPSVMHCHNGATVAPDGVYSVQMLSK